MGKIRKSTSEESYDPKHDEITDEGKCTIKLRVK